METTVRLASQRYFRLGSASNLAKPALAALAVALLFGAAGYVYLLSSKLALETANRQQVQTALEQAAALSLTMKEELLQARQEVDEAKQRLRGMAALHDAIARRETDIERLNTQLGEKEKELLALYKKASPKDETLAMLQSATVRAVALAGVDTARSAGGLILYDTTRDRAYLYAFNLPALPPGKVYQLWAGTTKPVSAGTFKVDTGRKARHLVRNLAPRSGTTKFTVSVEPEGGRPQPTGAIVLRGSL